MAGSRWVSLDRVRVAGACALLGASLGAALVPLPAAAQGQSAQPGTDGALTPPPVVDPKKVETTPVAPAGRTFAPQEITLSPVPVLTLAGSATWEEAFEKLVASVKQTDAELQRLGLARSGDTFIVYTSSDDLSFEYEIQVPFSGTTTRKPGEGMKLGGSHAGKVLKFTHAGSFADMDNTYEQIANYLDEKNVEQNDMYIEQYRTDIVTGSPDALTIDILVPVP
ncbi:GyrI-like domain-containing protein [Xanthobacter autotrophicus]|uniref:GyrI-like domain-containing protein n=1 Tax=Xanthobacter autotrophicus TaxID=280 RepID=UPI0024A70C83|nr:GyrI-like domain-containing protein [Xanthobacter autotrophicus]MDI4655760.1 GyrI-like domain-containing protein [Xanthobacter autotrophicus]